MNLSEETDTPLTFDHDDCRFVAYFCEVGVEVAHEAPLRQGFEIDEEEGVWG